MQKIVFDNKTKIYKDNFEINKIDVLNFCKSITNENKLDYIKIPIYESISINSTEIIPIKNWFDILLNFAIKKCKEIYTEKNYNNIATQCWVNVLKGNPLKNGKEIKREENYHIHTEINQTSGYFYPNYAFVFYLQMPDILEEDDAVLWFKGENGNEYNILPKEGEFIIMDGDIPHAPEFAPKAKKERIVFAGNIGFRNIKNNASLL